MEIEVADRGGGGRGDNYYHRQGVATAAAAAAAGVREERGAYLVWEDLTVVLPNFGNRPTKWLLQGLHGYAVPGRIMAIMGPSGSGKSTLLDSLAGLMTHPSLSLSLSSTA